MSEFEKLPEVVMAEQWDGTAEGAVLVVQFLGPDVNWVEIKTRVWDDRVADRYLFISNLRGLEGDDRMYSNDWIVREGGKYKIIDHDKFTKSYKRRGAK